MTCERIGIIAEAAAKISELKKVEAHNDVIGLKKAQQEPSEKSEFVGCTRDVDCARK